jgi:hypothetical protein
VISEPLLRSFCDGLRQQSEFAREVNQRTNKFLAEKFSPFIYLDIAEPKLSSITADLLQPDGSHGQGDAFLRAFLRVIGIADRGAPVQIRVEQPTRFIESIQRRVDIKLCWSDFIVGIENKPWALDQVNQLEDYINDLDRESKGRFLCVYPRVHPDRNASFVQVPAFSISPGNRGHIVSRMTELSGALALSV